MMKAIFVAFLLVSLVLTSSLFEVTVAGSALCDSKCGVRCSKVEVKDWCLNYCGICCDKCKCPCYRDMKNSKGKL